MTVKLSRDSFVNLLTRSGLVDDAALDALVSEYQSEGGAGDEDGEPFAQFLVRKGQLTTWQAKKLLQGKHRGFLLGKYRLLSLLGRGGMSSVYLAEHIVMRRRCAIKVLPTKHVNNAAALDRFYQEAQAVAALDDPHIVRAYDVDMVQEGKTEIHFLVMEYVEGRSLQEVVEQDGPLSLADAVNYICQAASGLGHAHHAGMVHRDVKPSNLLLDSSGTVKVLDMGLARFFEQADQQSLTLQHDQRVLGTADYLSPEQAVDSHTVGTRSDIYSLGGTLYFLLAGHPPFPEGTLAQRLLAHQTKQPKPISSRRPDIPASFARILERMMAKQPDERPASAAEVRSEFLEWLDQHGEAFADATVPPVSSRPQKSADPTAAGWSDLPSEESLAAPTEVAPPTEPVRESEASQDDSHVVSDPNLGQFLSGLSSEIDPAREESDRLGGAETVVSKDRPQFVPGDSIPVAGSDSQVSIRDESPAESKATGSSSVRDSQTRRHQKQTLPIRELAAGVAVLIVLLASFLFWPSSKPSGENGGGGTPRAGGGEAQSDGTGTATVDVNSQRPPVEPGSDVTVGPEGNFATINEAITYVRSHFQPLSGSARQTIRVSGGATYQESIQVDNSSFGAFPRGVSIICNDAEPAVLAPTGQDPVVSLVNVESFRLQGFRLAGPQRPVMMKLEGYLVRTQFENLTIEGGSSVAIEAVGVSGLAGRPVEIQDLLILSNTSDAVGITFATAKDLVLQNCRFAGPMQTGVSFAGDVHNLDVQRCRFDRVTTPIRFLDSGPFERISFVNNTLREFEQGVVFSEPPKISRYGIGFHKNLFTGVGGAEVLVNAASSLSPATVLGQLGASLNWSEGTATSEAGALDVFQQDGRRGIDPLSFVSTDAKETDDFLKPQSLELRQAAKTASNPKYIGAVAPVGAPN